MSSCSNVSHRLAALGLALAALSAPAVADTLSVPKDFPSLQLAVDQAQPGDVIELSSGTYEGTVILAGRTGLTIRGKGKAVLQLPAGAADLVLVQGSRNVRIMGLDLRGADVMPSPGDGTDGLHITGSEGVDVRDCEISGFEFGLRAEQSRGVLVQDCEFTKDLNGILLDESEASTLLANEVRDAGRRGIYVFDSESCILSDNDIRDASFLGIHVFEGTGNLLLENSLKGGGGIQLSGSSHQVLGNSIKGCYEGIHLTGELMTVGDNKVVGSETHGIRCNATRSTIAGNTVKKSGSRGLSLGGLDLLVTGNKVSRSADDGIEVQTFPNTIVFNRSIKNDGDDLSSGSLTENVLVANKTKTGVASF